MTDHEDEDALFARLEESLTAMRQDAKLLRTAGAGDIASGLARAEAELHRLAAACDALRIGFDRQQDAIAHIGAAAAAGAEERQRLYQVLEALASKMQQWVPTPAAVEPQSPFPPESRLGATPVRAAARAGIVLLVLVMMLGSGIGGWIVASRQASFDKLLRELEMRASVLIGFDLAGRGVPAEPRGIEAEKVPAPAPKAAQPRPQSEPVAAEQQTAALPPPVPAPTVTPAASGEKQAQVQPLTTISVPQQPQAPSSGENATSAAPTVTASLPTEKPADTAMSRPAMGVDAAAPQPETNMSPAAEPAGESSSIAKVGTVLPQTPGQSVVAHQILLRATADTWVWVRQEDGPTLLRKILKAGEIWNVPATPRLILDTGHAGGLLLEIDGVPARLNGAKGDVVRGVLLDSRLIDSDMVRPIGRTASPPVAPGGSPAK